MLNHSFTYCSEFRGSMVLFSHDIGVGVQISSTPLTLNSIKFSHEKTKNNKNITCEGSITILVYLYELLITKLLKVFFPANSMVNCENHSHFT